MEHIFRKSLIAISLSMVMVPSAYATNGLAPTGLGQIHKAMGGAAVGNPQNTTTMMMNPAAASFVSDGFDVGGEIFKPNRTVTSNLPVGPGSIGGSVYKGDAASAFFIPEAAFKKDMGKYSVGIVAYGNGGMNTSFKPNSPMFPTGAPAPNNFAPFNGGAPSTTGVDLKQLFVAPTISTKINENHSVGLSINLVAQQFHATGLQAFQGNPRVNPAKLEAFQDPGTSTSTGIGATLGWMGKINENFTVGASYRLKTKMSDFDKYKGLFPGGSMDVPAALAIGMSTHITPDTLVAVDWQRIYYKDVKATGNPFNAPGLFGDSNGPGFGWDNQNVFKIGLKTQATPKLALMAGYNHGKSPVGSEDTFFNALTPAVVEDHLSVGFEYALSKKSSIVGSYIHTFENEVKGDLAQMQPFDLKMDQDAVGIAYSKQF